MRAAAHTAQLEPRYVPAMTRFNFPQIVRTFQVISNLNVKQKDDRKKILYNRKHRRKRKWMSLTHKSKSEKISRIYVTNLL